MSAAMSRKHRARAPRAAAVVLDHGPGIRIRRGDVVVADRADPDSPNRTVRGARVIYHAMWAADRLGDHHHEAADRLLVALEAAQGAKDRGADFSGVRLAPWQQGHPSARAVQAAADLRTASEALGPAAFRDLVAAVGANVWPASWGAEPECWHAAPQETLRPMKCSLEILVQVWRITA